MGRRELLWIAPAVVCALAAASPAAARSWSDAQAVGDGFGAAVASDRFGNALVGYISGGVGSVVQVRTLSPAGVLGPPATIVQAPAQVQIRDLNIATDADGDAVVAWLQVPPTGGSQIGAATRSPGGPFGPPQLVGDDVHARPPTFDLSIASGGWAALVWDHGYGPPEYPVAAIRPPGGAFGLPERAGPDWAPVDTTRIAIDAQGGAVAVWDNWGEGAQIAARPPGGPWGPVEPLGPPSMGSTWPNVAIDDQGNALAVFMDNRQVQARYRPAGGAFAAAELVSQPPDRNATSAGFFLPSPIGFDSAGAATVLWRDTPANQLFASTRPSGGAFGSPTAITQDAVESARLAVSADGSAVAAWVPPNQISDFPRALTAAVRESGGDFGAPATLSDRALDYDVATDATGHGLAAWTASYGGNCSQVVVAGYSDRPATGEQPPPPACGAPPPPPADTTAPAIKLTGARRQRPLNGRRVLVAVRCDEDCSATAKGTLTLRAGRGRAASKRLKLKAAVRQLTAGKRATVALRFSARQTRTLRKALAAQTQSLTITVSATDGASNTTTVKRTISLTR